MGNHETMMAFSKIFKRAHAAARCLGPGLALPAISVCLGMAMLALPTHASATSRIDRSRLAIPADFLADEEPPECARQMWSSDPQAILAIEQAALLACRRRVNSGNRLRLARERQITDFRKTVIEQRMRVTRDPDYGDRVIDLDIVSKLLEQSACNGPLWTGYDDYMNDFIIEYRRMARIVRIRNGESVSTIVPQCGS